jgi:hypothetical protein
MPYHVQSLSPVSEAWKAYKSARGKRVHAEQLVRRNRLPNGRKALDELAAAEREAHALFMQRREESAGMARLDIPRGGGERDDTNDILGPLYRSDGERARFKISRCSSRRRAREVLRRYSVHLGKAS